MILAFDTYYYDSSAKTVCVAFEDWRDEKPQAIYEEIVEHTEPYQSGEFYRRELPCILGLLRKITVPMDAIIIDGYVYLDDNGKPGLGGHLYNNLEGKLPVIGVGKTNFMTIEKEKQKVFRGKSIQPLYVTAVGIGLPEAAELVQQMAGEYRMPTLLRQLDTLTRLKT